MLGMIPDKSPSGEKSEIILANTKYELELAVSKCLLQYILLLRKLSVSDGKNAITILRCIGSEFQISWKQHFNDDDQQHADSGSGYDLDQEAEKCPEREPL